MADDLFLGLPPPSTVTSPPPPSSSVSQQPPEDTTKDSNPTPIRAPAPVPALKSALKRKNPPENQTEVAEAPSQKGVRFKTSVQASETQVIEAMQKIASHIKNPTKFNKASKLAVQLIHAGSVKTGTSDYFFTILEAAMSSTTACSDPSVRADYHTLFTAAQDVTNFLTPKQKNQLIAWSIRAVVGNDLYTDDSFVFSKAAGRVKEIISSLPIATKDDDVEEGEILKDECKASSAGGEDEENLPSVSYAQSHEETELDPFGLDALLDERPKGKKEALALSKKADEEESRRFLRSQREALILCLEIAARRYRVPWCQTVIDILVKHAYDNIERFTREQRRAIEKLWVCIREQQTRRKQGKSVSGKLDTNDFELLQQKYANEKISIRNSVGGSTRRAEQWLG